MNKLFQGLFLALLAVIPLVSLIPCVPVSASGSIGVSPSIVSDSIVSGGSRTYNITVNTGFAIDVEVDGLGQTPSGATIGELAQNDTSPFTARPWVSLNENQMAPGNGQTLAVTVAVPPGTAMGEYFAAVLLQSLPGSQDDVDITSGILIPVILTVNAGYFTSNLEGQLSSFSAGTPIKGQPIDFTITFNNTGNCLISNAKNTVTLRDSSQNVIWQNTAYLTAPSLIPGYPRTMDVSYGAGLDAGYYSATSVITVPNGTLASGTIYFSVSAAPAWDVNGDHGCDVRDLILVSNHIGETGAPGWIPEDVNKDGVINVSDLISVGNHLGQTW
jgi:hypothetical protein